MCLTRWHVPVDNTHMKMFGWRHFNDEVDPLGAGNKDDCGYDSIDFLDGQSERPYDEGQRAPSDWEALGSQRPIAVHALENPGQSDIGVYLCRKLLRSLVRGETPADTTRDISAGGKDTLSMYTQDSVLHVPPQPGKDDAELMKEYGRKVLAIMIEADELPSDKRDAHVRTRLDDLDGGLLQAAEYVLRRGNLPWRPRRPLRDRAWWPGCSVAARAPERDAIKNIVEALRASSNTSDKPHSERRSFELPPRRLSNPSVVSVVSVVNST